MEETKNLLVNLCIVGGVYFVIVTVLIVIGISKLCNIEEKIDSLGYSYFGNKEPKTRQLICVMNPRRDRVSWFEVGKTYEVKNGKVIDEQGYAWSDPYRDSKEKNVMWVAGFKFYVLD